jgi:hypothetical protein
MYSVQQKKWNDTHYKWNDIKFGADYQQYLLDTFGITVTDGRVLWGHVVEVTVIPTPTPTPSQGGGAPQQGVIGGKPKISRKKIKLIFIMDDIHKEQTKYVQDDVSAKLVSDIQNNIEEQLQTKISLSDVQIIEG